jgi:predicted HicB family RNase H-like nuclease
MCYNSSVDMSEEAKIPRNIRIRPSVLHQARVAAVIRKKTLGQWFEEAIIEKIDREQKQSKEI